MKPTATRHEREESLVFRPTFDRDGLILCITCDAGGQVLMAAFMNEEALRLTIETRVVHYWSRSRQSLWRKGDTSGQTQHLLEMTVDCDQDALMVRVDVAGDGGACHTGRRSCFYRRVDLERQGTSLSVVADARVIGPQAVPI